VADSGTLSWVELLVLMVHGPQPEPTVRGAIRSTEPADVDTYWASAGDTLPVPAGTRPHTVDRAAPPPVRVWRDGAKVRIEEPDGALNLIVGESRCWRFDGAHESPVESDAQAVYYGGNGTELLTRRDAESFLGDDFTRPTGPVAATTFLGRRAWSVELRPPPRKPHPLQIIVDAETGLVLQQRNDGSGIVTEWVEFVVGEPLEPELFTWSGPVRSADEQQAEWRAEHERDDALRRRWFADNVTPLPLTLELQVAVHVHVHDDATGAFEGSIDHGRGSVARRPRSDEPWDLHWQSVQHRWSTGRWDWAVSIHDNQLTPTGLESLRRQLSGEDHPR
jgi:hypothetical protein